MRPVGAVADEAQRCLRPLRAQLGEGRDHVGHALDRRHPTDPADDETVGRKPERATKLRAVLVRPDPTREIDAEADHAELLRRCDPQRHQLVANLGPDGHEARGAASQRSLRLEEQPGLDRPEVPTQHVPVEGVHDHGRPCGAGEQRRSASDRPGLRRMRVQDVRPQAADLAPQRLHRDRVPERRELALEGRHTDRVDSELLGDEGHRVLALGEAPRDERRVIAAVLELPRQVADVQRRAAHVQPSDHPQDADRLRQARRSSGGGPPRGRPSGSSRARRGLRRRPPRSRGCRPAAAARTSARPASPGWPRSCPRRG